MVTKKAFLDTIKCPTLGWLNYKNTTTELLPISTELLLEEGSDIHERARTLFPDGRLVSGDNETAANQTLEYIQDDKINTIFEATFLIDGYIAKTDILIRGSNGWKIYEVKSGINDKDEYIEDLSYTVMVAKRADIDIANCSLMLVSKDYRLGMDNTELFVEFDHSEDVKALVVEFNKFWKIVFANVSQESQPEANIRWECKGCNISKECVGAGINNHIFDLPRISQKAFNELFEANIFEVENIPASFKLSAKQAIVREAVINNITIVNKEGLSNALDSIDFPAYYLDFETTQTAIPLYNEIAPYDQILTQYSLHVLSSPGIIERHYEYIADPSQDCRRQLAERLISDCGDNGSVAVYTSFEKTRIKSLINSFPDLQNELEAILERIVDLNKTISDNLYHPGFHGSYSIKNVLPVMIPDLSYDNMDVSNGLDASATFAYLAKGRYDDKESENKKEQLLEYCKLDTLAMVKLHESLETFI